MDLKKKFFKYILKKEVEEESNLDEDLLQLLTIITDSPSIFDDEFKLDYDYDKFRYNYYLVLKNKNNTNQIITLFVGYRKTKKDPLNIKNIFSEFRSENPNFYYENLILPKELKNKLGNAYLYKYTNKARVNQLKTDLLFGLGKNDD